ncbi:hypothetical protein EST38_g4001 [Candolleomyces aberdarensis]|uniref:F-box domain-containing protein n=1 Tax=Candolleomyces aberdarensis TaxID=2316362 RepID=A0A4V1Q4F1_9AGAR|nr:hypothetical protein EST38_g4001 [Candolleomyces aberdarensis]
MKGLPPEIQLLIVEILDVLDIFHLQQTCKYLYKLIEAFDHVIWRKCLQRQCTQNGLFWPSYRKHATSDEFKSACTANLRFRNTSRKWEGRSASHIPSTVEMLEFDGVPIHEFYLVPGGRFLITFHHFYFRVWSLYPSALWNGAPKVGYIDEYRMQYPFSAIAYVNVVNGSKIDLLLYWTTESDLEDQEMTSLLRLEITIKDGSDIAFSFRKLGLIQFLHDEDEGWRPEGVVDDVRDWELFSNNEFVFYVNGSGIHGFKIPPLQPITEEHVTLSSFSDTRLSSSFLIPHIRPYYIADSACIIGPENCSPVSDQQPVIYIIKETEDGDGDNDSNTFLLHWYQFRFNSSDPGSSTLTLLDTTSLNYDDKNSLSTRRTYYAWGDQIAIIWEGTDEDDSERPHTSFYLSLSTIPSSPSLPSSTHPSTPNSHGKKKENSKILPFARYPVAPDDDDTVPVPLGHAFCPHTGKAAVRCWIPEDDECWIDWYDFVARD